MATFTAAKAGNWTAADTWDLNSSYPQAADDAVVTGYTVTMDAAVAVTNLTIGASGVLVAGAYTITVSGNWDSSAGTFTYNTSTIVMTGTGASLKAKTATYIYKLTIAAGASITLLNGLYTTGLTTLDGSLAIGSYNFTVGGGLTQGANGSVSGAGTLYSLYYNSPALTLPNPSAIAPAIFEITEWTSLPVGTYSPTTSLRVTLHTPAKVFTWKAGAYTFTSDVIFESLAAGVNTITSVNNPNLVFQKNVTMTETAGTIAWTKGTGTITLSGTAAQTINLKGKAVDNIIVNKPTSGDITWTSGDTITMGGAWDSVNITIPAGVILTTSNYNITLSGNWDQSSTSSRCNAGTSTITQNGNGTFKCDGTVISTGYNSATVVLNGTNTLTYGNLAFAYDNGFNNLTVGQSGNTTTILNSFAIKSVLTIGSGTLTGTSYKDINLISNNPLSFNAASTILLTNNSTLAFRGGASQTIPTLNNGYDCDIYFNNFHTIVTQTGDITITGKLFYAGTASAQTWKTAGYNLSIGTNLSIGANSDTFLKKLDATSVGGRTSTITVGGNWLNYGNGTAPSQFIADNSTVIFTGTGTITSGAQNSKFNNVQFNGGVIYYNRVTVTGTLNPDATGTYTAAGTYNGRAYYRRGSDNWYLYWFASISNWFISPTLPYVSGDAWYASRQTIPGTFTPGGAATGTATVANVTGSGIYAILGDASRTFTIADELRCNSLTYTVGTLVNPGYIKPWPYPADACVPLVRRIA
jgi:hypothetical protein